jgi:hypothetical protein
MPYFYENRAPSEGVIDARVGGIYALEEGEVHPLGFDRFVCFIAISNKSVVSGYLRLLPGLLAAPAEEEDHSAGGGRKCSGDNIWGGVEETVVSYIFVRYSMRYTNVSVLPSHRSGQAAARALRHQAAFYRCLGTDVSR